MWIWSKQSIKKHGELYFKGLSQHYNAHVSEMSSLSTCVLVCLLSATVHCRCRIWCVYWLSMMHRQLLTCERAKTRPRKSRCPGRAIPVRCHKVMKLLEHNLAAWQWWLQYSHIFTSNIIVKKRHHFVSSYLLFNCARGDPFRLIKEFERTPSAKGPHQKGDTPCINAFLVDVPSPMWCSPCSVHATRYNWAILLVPHLGMRHCSLWGVIYT